MATIPLTTLRLSLLLAIEVRDAPARDSLYVFYYHNSYTRRYGCQTSEGFETLDIDRRVARFDRTPSRYVS